MKFIFAEDKVNAVNFAFIVKIFVEKSTNCVNANLIEATLEGSITTFTIKSFDSAELAKNYLSDLAKDFNFLIDAEGITAVNPAAVRKFFIDNLSVNAEVYDGNCTNAVLLKKFNSGDAAKDYFAELVKILNGGAK